MALPAQLLLQQLRSLSLRLQGGDALAFGSDLLACVDAPLQRLAVTAEIEERLLNALAMAVLQSELESLKLSFLNREVTAGEQRAWDLNIICAVRGLRMFKEDIYMS